MLIADLLGAALTLVALAFLALGGGLLAVRLLGSRAAADPLALAVASLLLATGEALAIVLLLGALGVLRIDLALTLQGVLVVALLLDVRRRPPAAGVGAPFALLARRTWDLAGHYWAPSLLTLHAVGAEVLRGLLRPPLGWDAMSYHLVLTSAWLRDQNLEPVFGSVPLNYHGYVPANGSLWFWWWMAPSHSEFYVNLATFPHWLLLGLATGAVARALGAVRHWPIASYLTLLTPIILRFAATEYVDIFVAAVLLAGLFFALRWLRTPSWSDALLFGCGLGLAAGAKVLGLAYALAALAATALLARGAWRRRLPQLLAVAALMVLLGSYFYLRNATLGGDPLATTCERTATPPELAGQGFPRPSSALGAWDEVVARGQLLEAFLGSVRPGWRELGVGPQALLLLFGALALPWLVGRERRREAWVAGLLVWAALALWFTVPFARQRHVYANVRYLDPCIGLACAGLVCWAERRGARERWLQALAVALLVQDLLQLRAEMPFGVRGVMALADLLAVALVFSPALRALVARRWRELALTALAATIAAAPFLVRFRLADRGRALATEFTAHSTPPTVFAPGWAWLDSHGGDGNVAISHAPHNYLAYPAMGPRLERDVRYVNVNAADHRYAIEYPGCQPRVDPAPAAWVNNLVKRHIRWIYLARYPQFDFPIEERWAAALPRLFALRYADATNRIYELTLPPPPPPSPQGPPHQ
ncbi:MAG TPA: hypothetical protein VGV61_14110 [Thermoanaerobaculia bacterium]|nr:hypothetical protein [Thermoanaerobaculia bacterium]